MAVRNVPVMDTIYTSIKATIKFSKINYTVDITGNDIVRYKIDNTLCSEGLPIGKAAASQFSLEMRALYRNGKRITSTEYSGAKVSVYFYMGSIDPDPTSYSTDDPFSALETGESTSESASEVSVEYSPFGVWYVNGTENVEQSDYVTLDGYDVLGLKGEDLFREIESSYKTVYDSVGDVSGMYYNSNIGDALRDRLQSVYGIKSNANEGLCPSYKGFSTRSSVISENSLTLKSYGSRDGHGSWITDVSEHTVGSDSEETVMGAILAYALCNMGFARINWSGELEFITIGFSSAKTSGTVQEVHPKNIYNGTSPVYLSASVDDISTKWVIKNGNYIEYSDGGGGDVSIESVCLDQLYDVSGRKLYKDVVVFKSGHSKDSSNSYKMISLPCFSLAQTINDVTFDAIFDKPDKTDGIEIIGENVHCSLVSDDYSYAAAKMWLNRNSSALKFSSGSLKWFGHPEFMVGDEIEVTTLDGEKHNLIATHLSITFDSGGLMTEIGCKFPSIKDVSNKKFVYLGSTISESVFGTLRTVTL